MSALTMLGLAVMGAVLYTLFQKSAPAFGLFVSMGAAVRSSACIMNHLLR